jgi:hypothetical protein
VQLIAVLESRWKIGGVAACKSSGSPWYQALDVSMLISQYYRQCDNAAL